MAVGLDYFRWLRSVGGYEWQDATSFQQEEGGERDSRFLVARDPSGRAQQYHPLVQFPTLFKEFAALEPAEPAFAAFAGKYGFLANEHILQRTGSVQVGEPMSRWWHQWSRIRAVTFMLDAVQSGNAATLEACVTIRKDAALLRLEPGMNAGMVVYATLADGEHMDPWLWQFALTAPERTERLARLVKGWIQKEVNAGLRGRDDDQTAATARILFDHERQDFTLHIVPTTLAAAMWFQLARAMTTNPTFKACEHCSKWFELSPDARRKQSKYCSDRCKVAAYRARRLLAAER